MLTKEQQSIADIVVLKLIELPLDQQVSGLKQILEMYVGALMAEFPDLPEEAVVTNSVNFNRAIISRLRELVLSGPHSGHG